MNVTASMVLYNNDPSVYIKAIKSFLNACNGILYVIDNSEKESCEKYLLNKRVVYIYIGKNIGFGAAHNKVLDMISDSDYHLILNPDIEFNKNVINELLHFMEINDGVGAVMPKIVYPDGRNQKLCKLLPSPVDLILRRFFRINNNNYELPGLPENRISNIPSLSGCFLIIRTAIYKSIKGFDERYFLYMEDVDLIRRIGDLSKTIYYPHVCVVHGYNKGSYKKKKLLYYHIRSAIYYFNKWGWLNDKIRKERNNSILKIIRSYQ